MSKALEALISIAGQVDPSFAKSMKSAKGNFKGIKIAAAATGAAVTAAMSGIVTGTVAAVKELGNLAQEFESARNTIRIGTGATGEDLDALYSDMKEVYNSVPTTMEDASQAIADYNTRLGLTGDDLQALSVQAIQVSDMLGEDLGATIESSSKAFQQWNIDTEDMTDSMDYIFKVSQSTGSGFNDLMSDLQSYGAQLQEMGYSFEESAALMGQLDKAGVNTSEVLGAMKKSVASMAKDGVNASDGIKKYYEEILNAEDSTKAAQIATEIFGTKAAPTMAAAIREGSMDVQALTASLQENAETINTAATETYTFSDKLQLLKQNAQTALEPIATKLLDIADQALPYIQTAMDQLVPIFAEFSDTLMPVLQDAANSILPTVGEIIQELVPTVREILPYAVKFISKIFGFINQLLPKLTPIIDSALPVLFSFLDGIMGIFDSLGPVIMDILGFVGDVLVMIMPYLQMCIDTILPMISNLIIMLEPYIGMILDALFQFVSMALPPLITAFNQLCSVLLPVIMEILDAFLPLLNPILDIVFALLDPVMAILPIVIDMIKEIAPILKPICTILKPIAEILGIIIEAISKVVGWVSSGLSWLIQKIFGGGSDSEVLDEIQAYAAGGFTNGISIAGEAGTEAVISFDPAYRSQNIAYWAKAGQMLGADASMFESVEDAGGSRGSSINLGGVSFAPNITINGNADKEDVMAAIREAEPEFFDYLEEFISIRKAESYAAAY